LVAITILFVPANLKVRKKALNGFIQGYAVLSKFIPLEVILDIRWSKAMPIDHGAVQTQAVLHRKLVFLWDFYQFIAKKDLGKPRIRRFRDS
jgi:hypothetical protein